MTYTRNGGTHHWNDRRFLSGRASDLSHHGERLYRLHGDQQRDEGPRHRQGGAGGGRGECPHQERHPGGEPQKIRNFVYQSYLKLFIESSMKVKVNAHVIRYVFLRLSLFMLNLNSIKTKNNLLISPEPQDWQHNGIVYHSHWLESLILSQKEFLICGDSVSILEAMLDQLYSIEFIGDRKKKVYILT